MKKEVVIKISLLTILILAMIGAIYIANLSKSSIDLTSSISALLAVGAGLIIILFASRMHTNKFKSNNDEYKSIIEMELIAEINSTVQNTQIDFKDSASSILPKVSNYLGADSYQFYVFNNDSQELELILTDTTKKSKGAIPQFKRALSKSLVEELTAIKEPLFASEMSNAYIKITSDLALKEPKSLLVYPFVFNETLVGLLELSSITSIIKNEIQFLDIVGSILGQQINSYFIRRHTEWLLFESKRMTEEMLVQEEQMRKIMEKLTSTQEELQKKDDEAQRLRNIIIQQKK